LDASKNCKLNHKNEEKMNYTFTEQEVEILIFPLAITTNKSRLTLLKTEFKNAPLNGGAL